jgi:hypothetical protein
VKAFRNDTLYVAPPHPDHWGTATRLDRAQLNATLRGGAVEAFTGQRHLEGGLRQPAG